MVAVKPYDPDSRKKTRRAPQIGGVGFGFATRMEGAIEAVMALDAITRKPRRFQDFAIVRALSDIHDGSKSVPAGAIGTVVDVIRGGQGYVVEFTEPTHVVLSALPSELAPA